MSVMSRSIKVYPVEVPVEFDAAVLGIFEDVVELV